MLKQIVLQHPAAAPSTSVAATHHPENIYGPSDTFVTLFHGDSEGYKVGFQQRPSHASHLIVGSPWLHSHTTAQNDGESLVSLPQENDADRNNLRVEADVETVTTDKPPSNIATQAKRQPRKRVESASTQTLYIYHLKKKKNTQK